jgi:hypothetical protein
MSRMVLNVQMLLQEFDRSFYTIPLMILLNILFLLIAFRYKSKAKSRRILILYAVVSLLANLLDVCLIAITQNQKITHLTDDYTILYFSQIEFIIFYIFFFKQFPNKTVQKKIAVTGKIVALLTLLLALYAIIFPFPLTIRRLSGYISVAESILILIPSFYYFYFLFLEPPEKNLLQEPSFWITTGIAFLHTLNLSNFLIDNYLSIIFNYVWPGVYSTNYIAYCFLFILFIISWLCQKDYSKKRASAYITPHLQSGHVNIKSSSNVF